MNIQMSCLRSKCVRLSRCNDIYLVTISDSTMATDCNSSTEVLLTDFPLHPLGKPTWNSYILACLLISGLECTLHIGLVFMILCFPFIILFYLI